MHRLQLYITRINPFKLAQQLQTPNQIPPSQKQLKEL